MMISNNFPDNYREKEIKEVLTWVEADESGVVYGIPGAGRAVFFRHLIKRNELLSQAGASDKRRYYFVEVDLHGLTDYSLVTLYRVILRSLYEARTDWDTSDWADRIAILYRRIEGQQDAFVVQSALRELLIAYKKENIRIIFIFNRFDRFLDRATPQMVFTLRALRDGFKKTLTYILGVDRPLYYLRNHDNLQPLMTVVDTHLCWITPLDEENSRHMIGRQYNQKNPDHEAIDSDMSALIFSLTGGLPMLIRVICNEWLNIYKSIEGEEASDLQHILALPSVNNRLQHLWKSFSAAEHALLVDIGRGQLKDLPKSSELQQLQQRQWQLQMLLDKGVCDRDENKKLKIVGTLFQAFIKAQNRKHIGQIYIDQKTKTLYQGTRIISGLTPLQKNLLSFLVADPHIEHTKSTLMLELWPDDLEGYENGLLDVRLQQVVSGLRKVIEPNDRKPIYIVTWRGRPQGGYKFVPDGQPLSRDD